jgi:thiol-disulfide isomerase/thioredoxin
MGKWLMRAGAIVLAVLVLIVTGCPPQEAEDTSKKPPSMDSQPPVAQAVDEEPVEKAPVPIEASETMAPAPKSIPVTKLPQALREACLVWIADPLPAGELTTVGGEKAVVADLLGKKATVVFFWAAGSSEIAQKTAAQALADLQADAKAVYGDQGLAVIAINPKDPADKVKELLGTVKVDYPVLLDAGGSYFAKIATEGLPRVYVLDEAGKIVWLDPEFSEVSRETLKLTLQVMLGEPQSAKN